jgi:hypothetical protein
VNALVLGSGVFHKPPVTIRLVDAFVNLGFDDRSGKNLESAINVHTGEPLQPVTIDAVYPLHWTHGHIARLHAGLPGEVTAWPMQVRTARDAARQNNSAIWNAFCQNPSFMLSIPSRRAVTDAELWGLTITASALRQPLRSTQRCMIV